MDFSNEVSFSLCQSMETNWYGRPFSITTCHITVAFELKCHISQSESED